MKIVKVVYSTKPAYAARNSENIKQVMQDLQQAAHQGIFYHACLGADGKTFTHMAFFESANDQQLLNDLPSFKSFQEQLKASGLEVPPSQELMTLVGVSKDFF
jgi:hypothetical protein